MEKILHLNVDSQYWFEVQNGLKIEEYRVVNDFWKKRLEDKTFNSIHYKLGYPKSDDFSKIMVFEFDGFVKKTITHEKFGNIPVEVYAISLRKKKKG